MTSARSRASSPSSATGMSWFRGAGCRPVAAASNRGRCRRCIGGSVARCCRGLRGFTKDLFGRLDQRCTGMEFATEMMIKSSLQGARIAELPIVLRPDGRKRGQSHLRTWRDGWRTLRFFLLYSPRWLFLLPGAGLILAGIAAYVLGFPQMRVGSVVFDLHTLLFGSLAIICGYQAIVFAVLTKVFAMNEGLLPNDDRVSALM